MALETLEMVGELQGGCVLPQLRAQWSEWHSGGRIQEAVCCKLTATCRCGCVQVTYFYDTGFEPHNTI